MDDLLHDSHASSVSVISSRYKIDIEIQSLKEITSQAD